MIRSWACQGLLSCEVLTEPCVISAAECPFPQSVPSPRVQPWGKGHSAEDITQGCLGTWVVEVVALSPHLGHGVTRPRTEVPSLGE